MPSTAFNYLQHPFVLLPTKQAPDDADEGSGKGMTPMYDSKARH